MMQERKVKRIEKEQNIHQQLEQNEMNEKSYKMSLLQRFELKT